jgi:hypothetical protein
MPAQLWERCEELLRRQAASRGYVAVGPPVATACIEHSPSFLDPAEDTVVFQMTRTVTHARAAAQREQPPAAPGRPPTACHPLNTASGVLDTKEPHMSGGSYNYLFIADSLAELQQREPQLREMADRLAGLGYAQDAARETEELLVFLRQWQTRALVRVARLAEVWQAVEWWDSHDSSEEAITFALEKYRAGTEVTPAP